MASNYVEIKVRASDTAKPDLTELKTQLNELGAKVETAKVDVDDRDAGAKLLDLNAKLADLNRKVASPRITVAQAARAEAQIAALAIELDKLGEKTARPSVELKGAAKTTAEIAALDAELDHLDDKASRSGPGGLLGKIMGSFGSLPGGAGLGELASNPYGIAAIAGGVSALLPELLGLVSGFAAAGAGAGAFALLAGPAVKQVETAYTGLSAAQKKYQDALAKETADPSKSHAKAVHDAAVNLQLAQDAIKKMPQSEQDAISGIHRLASEFGIMSKAFAPEAFKVFNAGLQLAGRLLPDIVPFARTFADVLSQMLGQASKFAGSKGFADWLKQFHSLEGPALGAIGHGIGQVVVQIGKLLTTMSAKDVVNAINIAFNVLSGTIDGLRHVIEAIMRSYDNVSRTAQRDSHDIAVSFDALRHDTAVAFDSIRHTFASAGNDIAHNFDTIRHAAASWFHELASIFDSARHTVASWADGVGHAATAVVNWFRALPGRILGALGNVGSLLVSAGRHLVEGFIHGIESMFGAVAAAAGHMIASLGGKVLHLLGISSPSKVAHWWGQMVAQGLADGIRDHAHLPADAAARMAAGVSSGMGSLAGVPGWGQLAGGHGGTVQLEVAAGGASEFEQFMLTAVRKWVRVKGGGDVQKAFGT